MKVVGYIRVSTQEQADSGAGLLAQRASIEAECLRRGWELVEIFEDAGVSGKSRKRRPGLLSALESVRRGEAGGLVVAKLDRLCRSLQDFADIVALAKKQKWNLVATDLSIDLATPNGKMLSGILAVLAEWERDLIGARTREGMAIKKAQGVKFGRPCVVAVEVRERIRRERAAKMSFRAIADGLNADRVKTGHGGVRWHASSVRVVLLAA